VQVDADFAEPVNSPFLKPEARPDPFEFGDAADWMDDLWFFQDVGPLDYNEQSNYGF
jgi:hypothetical protein